MHFHKVCTLLKFAIALSLYLRSVFESKANIILLRKPLYNLQDEVEGIWSSTGIRLDNKTFYEYTVEGEKLYVNFDGEWSEFTKEDK